MVNTSKWLSPEATCLPTTPLAKRGVMATSGCLTADPTPSCPISLLPHNHLARRQHSGRVGKACRETSHSSHRIAHLTHGTRARVGLVPSGPSELAELVPAPGEGHAVGRAGQAVK